MVCAFTYPTIHVLFYFEEGGAGGTKILYENSIHARIDYFGWFGNIALSFCL